jgi:thioester reductase-like protein
VYRLPFVGPAAGSGHFRLDRGDFLHNLVAGGIEMGSFPVLRNDLTAVLPVGYLSRTIAGVMTDDLGRIGRDYDFVNGTAPQFTRFFEMVGEAGTEVEVLPFAEWQRRARDHTTTHPASALARIRAVWDELTQEEFEHLLGALPPGADVFGGDVHPCPPIDARFVRNYVGRITAEHSADVAAGAG